MTDKGLDGIANQEGAAKVFKEQDTMEDLWNSFIHNKYSAIKPPAVNANDFELKPSLITMVQQNQFTGHPTENPSEHLGRFLRIANSVILKLKALLPKDYCLIPGNGAIKLVGSRPNYILTSF